MSEEFDTGNRLEVAEAAAREAGELILEMVRDGRAAHIEEKEGPRNLVTAADRASEELVRARLTDAFPDDRVAGEEAGSTGDESDFVWWIDPIDGTTNFAHGHPFYAVSIGLAVRGTPVLGAVFGPALSEFFSGEVGRGATRNGLPIAVSRTEKTMESLLATGFAYNRNDVSDNNLDTFAKISLMVRGLRRAGAASLDLSFVACGILDGFWELYLAPWDVCAGSAIVRAAGGMVTDYEGGDDFLLGERIVASNGRIHEQIRTNVR